MEFNLNQFKKVKGQKENASRTYISFYDGEEGYEIIKKLKDNDINVKKLITTLLKLAVENRIVVKKEGK